MTLIDNTMTPTFVDEVLPVFSSRSFDEFHFTIVRPSATMVGGKRIVCQTCRNGEFTTSIDAKSGGQVRWRVDCVGCSKRAIYRMPTAEEISEADKNTIMRFTANAYFRTRYPVPVSPIQFRPKQKPVVTMPSPSTLVPTFTPSSFSTPGTPLPQPQKQRQKQKPVTSPSTSAPALAPSSSLTPGTPLPQPQQQQQRATGLLRRARTTSARSPSIMSTQSPSILPDPHQGENRIRRPIVTTLVDRSSTSGPLQPVSLGPRIPMDPADKSAKRPRANSMALEQPSNRGEQSSGRLQKKRSRICAYSLYFLVMSC